VTDLAEMQVANDETPGVTMIRDVTYRHYYPAVTTGLIVIRLQLRESYHLGLSVFGGRGFTNEFLLWQGAHVAAAVLLIPGLLAYVLWRWARQSAPRALDGVLLAAGGVALALALESSLGWVTGSAGLSDGMYRALYAYASWSGRAGFLLPLVLLGVWVHGGRRRAMAKTV
jgi:hypothetical protein